MPKRQAVSKGGRADPGAWPAPADHPVARLVAERKSAGSRPSGRKDDAWLALVVEGGGMRGAVAGGMVSALEQLALGDVFDGVYGTSSGAIAGGLFITRQASLGTSAYYEELVKGPFISYRRFLAGGPLVWLEYLLGTVMSGAKSFDYAGCIASPIPLTVVATRITGREYSADYLRDFSDASDLREALRASCTVPCACGPPVSLRGGLYVDGSLTESIPIAAALADKASDGREIHVLALLTRPQGQLRHAPNLLERRILYTLMDRQTPGLGAAHLPQARRYAEEVAMLAGMPNALVVARPPASTNVRRLEQNSSVLIRGVMEGAGAVHLALTGSAPNFYSAVTPF